MVVVKRWKCYHVRGSEDPNLMISAVGDFTASQPCWKAFGERVLSFQFFRGTILIPFFLVPDTRSGSRGRWNAFAWKPQRDIS